MQSSSGKGNSKVIFQRKEFQFSVDLLLKTPLNVWGTPSWERLTLNIKLSLFIWNIFYFSLRILNELFWDQEATEHRKPLFYELVPLSWPFLKIQDPLHCKPSREEKWMIDLSTYAQRVHLKNLVVTSKSFNVDRLFVKINKINFDTVYLNISLFSLDHCIKFFGVEKTKCPVTLIIWPWL